MAMTAAAYLAPGAERVAAVVSVLAVTGLNLCGVRRSAGVTRVVLTVVGAVLLGVVVAAWWPGRAAAVSLEGLVLVGAGSDPTGILQGAALLFFAFAGYARIATLGEEVRDPARVIPRAVVIALGSVLVLYLLVGISVLRVLGVDDVAGSTDAVARTAAAAWGDGGWVWLVRLAAGLAALGALLNLVLGISRTTVAMARDGRLPRVLSRLAGPGRVPRIAELAVGGVVLAVVLVADLRGAIAFSSFGVLLYYAVANAAALDLARAEERRPGVIVPVIGLVGCLVLAGSLPLAAVTGGFLLVLAGLVGYVLTGRRHAAR